MVLKLKIQWQDFKAWLLSEEPGSSQRTMLGNDANLVHMRERWDDVNDVRLLPDIGRLLENGPPHKTPAMTEMAEIQPITARTPFEQGRESTQATINTRPKMVRSNSV